MNLDNQELLRRAVPPLAKRFGVPKERTWELLNAANQHGSLCTLVARWEEPEVRGQVNAWWSQFHSEFSQLGLGEFKRLPSSSASKVESELAYKQLVCLMWLTDALRAERARRWVERWIRPPIPEIPRVPSVPEAPPVPEVPVVSRVLAFWQWIKEWLRSILEGR